MASTESWRRMTWVTLVPERAMIVLIMLALSAGLWVSLGVHQPWTVLPTAALLTWWGWRRLTPVIAPTRAVVTGARMALAAAAAWMIVQLVWVSEYLIVVRDPGFLTLSGLWLVDHPHTDIPVSGADQAATASSQTIPDAAQAWNLLGDVVQPQGAKMMPATIAVGGWIAGTPGVLAANVVIGTVALLGMYAIARRFMGPLAALAPMSIVGFTVAHIAMSRSGYSEALTMALVMAGIGWAWHGISERRYAPLLAAAVATGAASLVRIDGAAFALGSAAGIVVALALIDARVRFRVTAAVAVIVVTAGTSALGYLALWRWSRAYLERLEDNTALLLAGSAAGATALVLWSLSWLVTSRATLRTTMRSRTGALVAAGATGMTMLVLASRPLWTTVHRGTEQHNHVFANSVVAQFQELEGLPVAPTRTYAEHTVTWLSYYLTWPLVIAGILGVSLLVYRGLRRDPRLLMAVVAMGVPAALYVWSPSIIPDQIWAIRRLAPSALPLLAFGAAAALWHARDSIAARSRLWGSHATTVAMVACLVLPLSTWIAVQPGRSPVVSVATPIVSREMGGSRAQIESLCDVIDGRPTILAGTSSHYGSLRVMCDVPIVLALKDISPEVVAQIARVWEGDVVVVTRSVEWFTWSSQPQELVRSQVAQAGYSLQRIPTTIINRHYSWYAGTVNDDGSLTPIDP